MAVGILLALFLVEITQTHHYRKKKDCWLTYTDRKSQRVSNVSEFPADIHIDWSKTLKKSERCYFLFGLNWNDGIESGKPVIWAEGSKIRVNFEDDECNYVINRGRLYILVGIMIGLPLGLLLVAKITIQYCFRKCDQRKEAQLRAIQRRNKKIQVDLEDME